MFERYTDRSRRTLVLAQEETRLLKHSHIDTGHILLGLVHEGEGIAATVLAALGIAADDVRQKLKERISAGEAPVGSPPFTAEAKKALELSLREALALGHNYIGTEHILLGLERHGDEILSELIGDTARVRKAVIEKLAGDIALTKKEKPSDVLPPAVIRVELDVEPALKVLRELISVLEAYRSA